MLSTLKGKGFDCLATLVSIKMEHPQPLHVCTNVCIIYAYTGAGLIRVLKSVISRRTLAVGGDELEACSCLT